MDQNVVVNFIARNTSFMGATKEMAGAISGVERQLTRLYKIAVGVGVGTVAAYYGASRSAVAFERNLRNVNSILGESERGLGIMANQMLQLSTEIPQSAADLSSGLYQVVSSGFTSAADSTMVLEASARAAVAGLTDTQTAAGAVSTVLNAYQMSAKDAAHVSDVLFQTVNVGVVTFEQLANNLGDFIGTARAAGATFEETSAAFSNISIAVGNPARSATMLQGIFRALLKPSEDMKTVLTELGYASGQAAVKAEGLDGILRKLNGAVKGDSTALTQLFQDTEGFQGVMALLAQDTAEAEARISMFTDKAKIAGVTNKVMAEQAKSVGYQMDQMKTAIGAVTISFGQVMLPVLQMIVGTLTFLARAFMDIPGPIKTMITAGGLILGVMTGLAGVYMLVAAKIRIFQMVTALAGQTMNGFAGTALRNGATSMATLAARTNIGASALIRFSAAARGAGVALSTMARAMPAAITAVLVLDQVAQHFAEKHYERAVDDIRKSIEKFAQTGQSRDLVEGLQDVDTAVRAINQNFDRSGMDYIKQFLTTEADQKGGMEIQKAARDIRELDRTLADMVSSGNAEAAQATFNRLKADWEDAGASTGAIDAAFSGYNKALSDADQSQKAAAGSAYDVANAEAILDSVLGKTAGQVSELDKAMKGLSNSQRSIVSSLAGAAGGFSNIVSNIVSSRQKLQKTETKKSKGRSPEEQAIDYAQALMGLERANRRVADAERELAEIRSRSWEKEIADAEEAISDAYRNTERASLDLIQAQRDLEEARKNPSARSIEEAEIELQRAIMAQGDALEETRQAHEQLAEAQDHGTPDELRRSEDRLSESLMRQKEAAWRVEDAEKALRDLREQPDKAEEIAVKERAVADAEEAVSDSRMAVVEAESELAQIRVNAADQPAQIADAEFNLKEALLGVQQAVLAVAQSQEKEAAEAADSFQDGIQDSTVSLHEFEAELRKNVSAHENWQANIATIADRYGIATAASLAKLGQDGAHLVNQLANATEADARRMGTDLEKWALYGTEAFNTAVVKNLGKGVEDARTFGMQTARALSEEMGIGIDEAIKLLEKYGYAIEGYASATLKEVSPGQYRMVKPDGTVGGPTFMADGGVREAHNAQIAKAGAWRVWAEPETGGEAYIPLSPSKRNRSKGILEQVANKFGYGLLPMARGGLVPPSVSDFARAGVTNPALATLGAQAAYYMTRWATQAGGAGGGNIVGVGRAIQGMGFHVSEHPAFGGILGRHSQTGYHYRGRAIDVNWRGSGPEAPMLDMLSSWIRQNVSPLTELLWRTKDHFDHLHLAMANGGMIKKYDNGGYLDPGFTMAYNGTGRRELVTTADGRGPGGGVRFDRGAIQVTVRAEAGVDEGRLAALVGEKVNTGVRSAVSTLHRELRRN